MDETLNKIVIPTATGMKIYSPLEICFCEASQKVTQIYFKDGKSKIINSSLSKIEKKFPANIFFRCHRSYLVNLFCIKEYTQFDGNKLHLQNGSPVTLSRRKKKELFNRLKKLQDTISISN